MKSIILSILLMGGAHAAEPTSFQFSDQAWVSRDSGAGVPKLRLEVNSTQKKIYLSFFKEGDFGPKSIGITFVDPKGKKTVIEMKAMDPKAVSNRYEGSITKAESFVGFEIRIPFGASKPSIIESSQMQKVEE